MITACEAMFGMERGAQMRGLVERATDSDCPCIQGLACPLVAFVEAGESIAARLPEAV